MKQLNALFISLLFCLSFTTHANLTPAINAFKKGDIKTAKPLFEAQKHLPDAQVYLAKIAMNNDLDKAEELIEQVIKTQPNHAQAWFTRGIIMGAQASNALFSALSYAKKSKNSFIKATELEPNNLEYQQGLFQFYLAAPSFAGGDIKAAATIVNNISKQDKRTGYALTLLLARQEEDQQKIDQTLAAATADYPTLPDFYYYAGIIKQQQEDYSGANTLLNKAVALKGEDEESLTLQQGALYQIGRTAVLSKQHINQGIQALEQYIAAEKIYPNNPKKAWAQFRLGNLLALKDEKQKAKEIYKQINSSEDKRLRKKVKKALKKLK